MKKSLVVVAVVVCAVCLAVAGSFAIFNTNFEINGSGNTITAKTFYIGAKDVVTVNEAIAPGEKYDWSFAVTNKNGNKINKVDMDMTITLAVAAVDADAIDNLTVKLIGADGNEITGVGTLDKGVGTITYSFPKAFLKGDAEKNIAYKVEIAWPATNTTDANIADTADGINGAASKITITVDGIQAIA